MRIVMLKLGHVLPYFTFFIAYPSLISMIPAKWYDYNRHSHQSKCFVLNKIKSKTNALEISNAPVNIYCKLHWIFQTLLHTPLQLLIIYHYHFKQCIYFNDPIVNVETFNKKIHFIYVAVILYIGRRF